MKCANCGEENANLNLYNLPEHGYEEICKLCARKIVYDHIDECIEMLKSNDRAYFVELIAEVLRDD